ncbi:hypothetical protein ABI59_19045 [Acidobacteria bacterium Mor1]|nr:hypothetical protein ABI59_19045 [Acidobacteria bacterium Mor1]
MTIQDQTGASSAGRPSEGPDWWRENGPVAGRCPNCGTPDPRAFCPNCGQRQTDRRLSLRTLLRELPSRFFTLERGLPRTFIDMFRSPGKVAFDYVCGARKRYASPLTYFFVAATVQIVALTLLKDVMLDSIRGQLGPQFENPNNPLGQFIGRLGENSLERFAGIFYQVTRSAYSYLWILFSAAVALAFRLMPFAGKRRFNLAEHYVFALFTISHMILVSGLLAPFAIRWLGVATWGFIVWGIYFGFLGWAAIGFYRGRWYTVFCGLFALGAAFFVYVIVFWTAVLVIVARSIQPAAG